MQVATLERDRKIDALEKAIVHDPSKWEIVHHFAPGIYAREMRVKAGTEERPVVITSKVHKYANLSILSKGKLGLYMADGSVKVVEAGFHILAEPGARRAAVVLEDAVWTTFHNTEERDLAKIESHFVTQTPDEYRLFAEEQLKLEGTL